MSGYRTRSRSHSRSRSRSPIDIRLASPRSPPRKVEETDEDLGRRMFDVEMTSRFFTFFMCIVNKTLAPKVSINDAHDVEPFVNAYTAVRAICNEEQKEILDAHIETMINFDHYGFCAHAFIREIVLTFNYGFFRRLERKFCNEPHNDLLSYAVGEDEHSVTSFLQELCKKAIPIYFGIDIAKQMFFETIISAFDPNIAKEVVEKEMKVLIECRILPSHFIRRILD